MADTSTRVTNMPDSGSPERVALDMARQVAGWTESKDPGVYTRKGFLDLYGECLQATRGGRNWKP